MNQSDKNSLNAQLLTYGCKVTVGGLVWSDRTQREHGAPVRPNTWRANMPGFGSLTVYTRAGVCCATGPVVSDFFDLPDLRHPSDDPAGAIMSVIGILRENFRAQIVALGDATPGDCSTEDAVVDLLRSRGAVGRRKYGVSMDRQDLTLTQWAQHLQEELGDALQYAERVKKAGKLLESAAAIMRTIDSDVAREWLRLYAAQFEPTQSPK